MSVDSWKLDDLVIVRVHNPTDAQLDVRHPSREFYGQELSLSGWTPMMLTFAVKPEEAQPLINELEAAGK